MKAVYELEAPDRCFSAVTIGGMREARSVCPLHAEYKHLKNGFCRAADREIADSDFNEFYVGIGRAGFCPLKLGRAKQASADDIVHNFIKDNPGFEVYFSQDIKLLAIRVSVRKDGARCDKMIDFEEIDLLRNGWSSILKRLLKSAKQEVDRLLSAEEDGANA